MELEPTKEDLQQLREWIQKMPHIIQDYDDQFLSAIVRARKGSLQKSKLTIENCAALGMRYPDFFGNFDPLYPGLQEHLSVWLIFPLPKKTPEGCTVFFSCLNPNREDASKSHIPEYYRYLLLSLYILLWENDFGSGQWQHVGVYMGVTLAHMKDMTPRNSTQIIKVAESGIPLRLHSITAFNVPTMIEHLFYLFKLVSKTKLAKRIHVYSALDKLTDHVPQNILPKEYGGCEESIFVLHDNWKKKVESYRERFLEEERRLKKLDPLRPLMHDDDDMAGTFRNLSVD